MWYSKRKHACQWVSASSGHAQFFWCIKSDFYIFKNHENTLFSILMILTFKFFQLNRKHLYKYFSGLKMSFWSSRCSERRKKHLFHQKYYYFSLPVLCSRLPDSRSEHLWYEWILYKLSDLCVMLKNKKFYLSFVIF